MFKAYPLPPLRLPFYTPFLGQSGLIYLLDLNSVKALASIPPRDELIGKLLGVAKGPVQGFVRTLNEVPSRLVRVLSAIRDQK